MHRQITIIPVHYSVSVRDRVVNYILRLFCERLIEDLPNPSKGGERLPQSPSKMGFTDEYDFALSSLIQVSLRGRPGVDEGS